MRIAYVDAFGGASGDMLLAGMIDAGADLCAINSALAKLDLGLAVTVEKVSRGGLAGLKATVLAGSAPADPSENGSRLPETDSSEASARCADLASAGHSHTHEHDHAHGAGHDHGHQQPGDHGHTAGQISTARTASTRRGFTEIKQIIEAAGLPPVVSANAIAVFHRLAIAEATVHGSTVEEVHFHEVGAADAIGDIVGVCAALDTLGIEQLQFGDLPTGRGTVRAAHGELPVPAPATLALLTGLRVVNPPVNHEMLTPTGAALLSGLGRQVPGWPKMSIVRIGIGAGRRDTERPNILRVIIGEIASEAEPAGTFGADAILIDTNLDDTTGQVIASALEQLLANGALDAWWSPCGMKKGRPGVQVSCLARPSDVLRMADIIFRELPTLGVRYAPVQRIVQEREHRVVSTPYGQVRVKMGRIGEQVFVTSPEYEDCRALARENGVPVRLIIQAAAAAAHAMLVEDAKPAGQ